MQYKDRTLSFKRSRTTVSIEDVDESWALELINEAEQEDRIQVADSGDAIVRLECCNEICANQSVAATVTSMESVEQDDTVEVVEKLQPILAAVASGPSAIDIQRMQWSSRVQQRATSLDARVESSFLSQPSAFKNLVKRWMHA